MDTTKITFTLPDGVSVTAEWSDNGFVITGYNADGTINNRRCPDKDHPLSMELARHLVRVGAIIGMMAITHPSVSEARGN